MHRRGSVAREKKKINLRSADKRERPKSYRAKAEESCVCWNRTARDGMTGGCFFLPWPARCQGVRIWPRSRRRNGKSEVGKVGWVGSEEEDCCLSNRALWWWMDGWMDDGCRIATLGSNATAEGPGRESESESQASRLGLVWCWVSLGNEESRWFGEADTQ